MLCPLLLWLLAPTLASGAAADGGGLVVEVSVTGVITSITASVVADAVHAAEADDARALLVVIDSPGGDTGALRTILGALASSTVPVLTLVPAGAEADAGALYLLEAGQLASVAPAATLGAEHALTLTGGIPGHTGADAATAIAILTAANSRSPTLPMLMVSRGTTDTGQTALDSGAVDLAASSPAGLLAAASGRTLTVGGTPVLLATAGARLDSLTVGGFDAAALVLADPDLDFMLLLIAVVCIGLFAGHPGSFVFLPAGLAAAAAGGSGLLLVPLNPPAIPLLAVGSVLLLAELHLPSHGSLTALGAIALAIGGNWLVATPMLDQGVSPVLIAGTLVLVLSAYIVLLPRIIAARRMAHKDPATQLVGRTAVATEALHPEGLVSLDGGLWRATATQGPIARGTSVRVVAVEGLRLTVEPLTAGSAAG